jgi:hypothetical protein
VTTRRPVSANREGADLAVVAKHHLPPGLCGRGDDDPAEGYAALRFGDREGVDENLLRSLSAPLLTELSQTLSAAQFAYLRPIVVLAVRLRRSHEVASALGVPRRTLTSRAGALGLASPKVVLGLSVGCFVAVLTADERGGVSMCARLLGFMTVTELRLFLKARTSLTPSEWGLLGPLASEVAARRLVLRQRDG